MIARRALMLWLYGELEACQGSGQSSSGFSDQQCQDTESQGARQHALPSCLPIREGQEWHRSVGTSFAPLRLYEQSLSGRFRRVGNWRLHTFVSQLPCGDACIFPASPVGNADHMNRNGWAELTARHRTGAKHLTSPISGSVHKASPDGVDRTSSVCSQTPAGCNIDAGITEPKQVHLRLPTAAAGLARPQSCETEQLRPNWEASQEEGVLRRKPGRGSPTQSLSCR